ncbi:hypothetical protein LCGC14_0298120 [marine sediment metagenome]|uniref:Uncharacterized protein n=1 Tax=marine sediment metagenome TaxID=412755 RepID=A0A0F9WX37_9ZZZZ
MPKKKAEKTDPVLEMVREIRDDTRKLRRSQCKKDGGHSWVWAQDKQVFGGFAWSVMLGEADDAYLELQRKCRFCGATELRTFNLLNGGGRRRMYKFIRGE